ncbi:TPA: DUF3265 domain-containing protein [Vibrio vulnificus]|nr:DUF3265 domain-containing protein [Vibrio vulnificus]HDY8137077.1 DUF3265 domain-containing protein [Vibrio vulnificus]HDY8150578.1 DUF3265 domain-containing protein [Vibrio vulnificus]HDY8155075.1 DUF3265 domain-containing protein [Vibrio vulnificus]
MAATHNKTFKRDSCRVAFLVCGDFCGESGVRKLGLGGIHPLTRRYMPVIRKSIAEMISSLKVLRSFTGSFRILVGTLAI